MFMKTQAINNFTAVSSRHWYGYIIKACSIKNKSSLAESFLHEAIYEAKNKIPRKKKLIISTF